MRLSGRDPSIQDDIRSRYQRSRDDVDLAAYVAERAVTDEDRIAEVIEADGRARIDLGLPVELRRYLDAIPGLVEMTTALDAAIEMALRSEHRSGRTPAEALDSLCRRHPDVAENIRDATALGRLIHSGLFAPGAPRVLPGPTSVDEEAVERVGPPPIDSVPGYRLVGEIFRGGQGVVYKAVQESTDRIVAVKVLSGGRFATEREQRRFEREVRLVAGLNHPSIVTIYDSGVHEGRHFYAMEYIKGEPLDHHVNRRALGIEETLRLFARICDAVRYAHERGIIHRDVKPQNIIVDDAGMPHLLDFGLAKGSVIGPAAPETITTEFVGTLAYASPEQLRGDPAHTDARTDVYSLGLILFQLLTGRHAYDLTGDFVEVARRISEERPPRPSTLRPEINDDLDTIILRAMAGTRERRYQTVDELARDIDHVLAGEAIRARHDSPWYLARAHYRTFVHRHFSIASAIMALVACLAAQAIGTVVLRAAPVTSHFERTMVTWMSSGSHCTTLDSVRIIGFADATAMARAAGAIGVPGVSAERRTSLRRLHGALLSRLARSGAGVVVFDITFAGATEYDDDFAEGVIAIRGAGADVVISTATWQRDELGRPPISDGILDSGVSWGCASGVFRADRPWRVHLALQKKDRSPEASLALAAVSAFRHPGALPEIDLDEGDRSTIVRFSNESVTENPRTRIPVDTTETFALSTAARHPVSDAPLAIDRGDLVGTSLFVLPDRRGLERRTIAYTDVLHMSDAALREAFAGTVVLVADLQPGVDRHDHAGERPGVPGVYAHAAAVGALLEGITIRYPDWEGWFLIALAAAVTGMAITRRTGPRLGRRAAALGVAAIGLLAASALAYRLLFVLWNPLVPVLALLIAAQLAAVAPPLYRTRWR